MTSQPYTDADVQAAADALWDYDRRRHVPRGSTRMAESAKAVLDAVAPAIAARAWDQGYAVASDDFTHSDYCGRKCQCEGIHGKTNPYRGDA